jgi:hypothetical protein
VCPGSGASGASAGARRSRHLPAVVPGPRPAAGRPYSSRIGGWVWCEGRRNCFYSARMTMLSTAMGNGVGPPRRASRRSAHHPTAHARPELSTADSATQPLLHINRLPAAYLAISKHLHLPNNSCHILHLEIDRGNFFRVITMYYYSTLSHICRARRLPATVGFYPPPRGFHPRAPCRTTLPLRDQAQCDVLFQ